MAVAHPQPARAPPQEAAVATKCTACSTRHDGMCDAITERDLGRLSAAAVVMRVEPGRRFIGEGGMAEDFFTVTEGTVRLVKALPDGRQLISAFASPGDFLGLSLWDHYAYSAEAIDAVRLCRFSRARLHHLIDDFPALEKRLLQMTSNELVLAQERMLLLGRKTAPERLASFLVMRAGKAGPSAAGEPVQVPLPMSRADIADYLGLTVETVSRTLTKMKADRLIEATSVTGIAVCNMAKLAALAGG